MFLTCAVSTIYLRGEFAQSPPIERTTTRRQIVIEVNGATKQYKDKVAVDDLSFELKPVQVTGFLGPNGSRPSGKPTLFTSVEVRTTIWFG